mmetsp:Transcript_7930/g.22836  ORF Transcript_7930/g.22836 Transcript_7930/m.22836 type:complete len:107 (-) Transcript_7930:306-626(-)
MFLLLMERLGFKLLPQYNHTCKQQGSYRKLFNQTVQQPCIQTQWETKSSIYNPVTSIYPKYKYPIVLGRLFLQGITGKANAINHQFMQTLWLLLQQRKQLLIWTKV